jgi:hypothetical protein
MTTCAFARGSAVDGVDVNVNVALRRDRDSNDSKWGAE